MCNFKVFNLLDNFFPKIKNEQFILCENIEEISWKEIHSSYVNWLEKFKSSIESWCTQALVEGNQRLCDYKFSIFEWKN
jgi:hypothetical protein